MAESYDVVVIGAGPGGYIAAIRAAQLGFKVACIDDWKRADGRPAPGGTCTNVGCIPSKALLQSSEHYEHAGHGFAAHGIDVKGLSIDVPRMIARKEKVVAQNNDGILFLFKKNKVAFHHGRGAFAGGSAKSGWLVSVAGDAPAELSASHVIVATGSKPRPLPGAPFDNALVLDNAGALALGAVPKRLGVVGAGVIGLEMGSVWRRLGAEVTVLEALPTFLGAADQAVAKEAHKLFTEAGPRDSPRRVDRVGRGRQEGRQGRLEGRGRQRRSRRPSTGWSCRSGACRTPRGSTPRRWGSRSTSAASSTVDDTCRTNLPQVWAVGDVVRGPMLAHKAEEEGVAVAERIAGQHGHVDFDTVPWVIYTSPEIAWVGTTEQQLEAAGVAYRSGTFPFSANGRARALGDTERLRQDPRRREDRPHPRRARHRTVRVRADRRGRGGDGVRRLVRGPCPHLPRPSVALGGHEGGGARGRPPHAQSLSPGSAARGAPRPVVTSPAWGRSPRQPGNPSARTFPGSWPSGEARRTTRSGERSRRLEHLAAELHAFRTARQSRLKRLIAPPAVPRGVYLWGGVGRGKSLLMDAFYATVHLRRKTRVHFHAFMRDVHEELARLSREADPLATVAERIAKRHRLVCFDEFHVSDIADAMILGRLLKALFAHGVVFVMTSNYPPEGLYPNGLQRQNFLPTIGLMREWLDVLEVDGGTDYRLRALEQAPVYHVPADAAADAALARTFDAVASGPDEDPRLAIEGRTIVARRRAGGAVWFDFAALCAGPAVATGLPRARAASSR